MLERISAPPNVRLACQLRPKEDLSVQILLPILPMAGRFQAKDDVYRWGVERDVTVLFVDIRAFNTLTRKQLPYRPGAPPQPLHPRDDAGRRGA